MFWNRAWYIINSKHEDLTQKYFKTINLTMFWNVLQWRNFKIVFFRLRVPSMFSFFEVKQASNRRFVKCAPIGWKITWLAPVLNYVHTVCVPIWSFSPNLVKYSIGHENKCLYFVFICIIIIDLSNDTDHQKWNRS